MRGPWLAMLALAGAGCGLTGREPVCDPAPGTLCTLAGIGEAAFNGDGRPAAETAFYLPSQVRRGPDGLVYVMDFNNHRLRRIEADGRVTTIAGDGFHAAATPDVPAVESALENPIDFDFLPDGRIVLVSYHDPRVFVIEHDETMSIVAGGAEQAELPGQGDGGPALAARFIELQGVAAGPDGAIYVSDAGAHRIRVIRNGMIAPFAGSTRGYGGDGAAATASNIDTPTALAVGADGALWFTDSENCAVRRVAPDGTIATVAGTGLPGYSGDGGSALAAELSHPDGIAVAADGTLYIADRVNSRIRRVAPDGTIDTVAGTGTRGYNGDGAALTRELGYVSRIQLEADGTLLVSDQTNHMVRVLAP